MSKIKVLLTVRPVWMLVVAVLVAVVIGYLSGLLTPIPSSSRVPLLDINDAILLGVLAALGIFVGHLYTRLGKVEDRNLALEARLDAAATRIDAVEAAKDAAVDKLTAAASFINRIGLWLTDGQRGPLPKPPNQILPHIDGALWIDDSPGGTDD